MKVTLSKQEKESQEMDSSIGEVELFIGRGITKRTTSMNAIVVDNVSESRAS